MPTTCKSWWRGRCERRKWPRYHRLCSACHRFSLTRCVSGQGGRRRQPDKGWVWHDRRALGWVVPRRPPSSLLHADPKRSCGPGLRQHGRCRPSALRCAGRIDVRWVHPHHSFGGLLRARQLCERGRQQQLRRLPSRGLQRQPSPNRMRPTPERRQRLECVGPTDDSEGGRGEVRCADAGRELRRLPLPQPRSPERSGAGGHLLQAGYLSIRHAQRDLGRGVSAWWARRQWADRRDGRWEPVSAAPRLPLRLLRSLKEAAAQRRRA